MTSENKALLEVVKQFKAPDVSELEAALNVIRHHAAEIERLNQRIRGIDAAFATFQKSIAELTAGA